MNESIRVPQANEVMPYYQPIVSLQTKRVFGYEALGRGISKGSVYSLGAFFKDPGIPDEVHIQVDRLLREKAMSGLSRMEEEGYLFLNIKPSWIYRTWRSSRTLPTLEIARRVGFDPSRIVIEVTEEEFLGHLQELTEIIEQYRAMGCTIAVDDVGSGFSNFDRIASLQPKILKVDLNILKKSAVHRGYRALLRSFSILASQMGSSLLIEGVETKEDLQNALRVGARYVQGYLLARPGPGAVQTESFEPLLREEIERFSSKQFEKFYGLFDVEHRLNKRFVERVSLPSASEANAWIDSFLPELPDNCLRVYICRGDGEQVSSNVTLGPDGEWRRDDAYQGANWLWRPYFIPNVLMMSRQGKGILSNEYVDLETSHYIQTYSCPIGENCYLFLDLIVR